jgi:organic hydroperoxide reductase OsmC/OhrA
MAPSSNDKTHRYALSVRWTGDLGQGTRSYRGYARDHEIAAPGKPTIPGSSDPAFRGDPARWNPEELFVAAVSACHKLWYLHLCASAGVVVRAYEDAASGEMAEEADGAGQFTRIVLRPQVTIEAGGDAEKARALHHAAHEKCFIARSIKTPVACEPTILTA